MKRRDFVARGGGFLGLSLTRFGQAKEGGMQHETAKDPKQVFLSRIRSIRKEFQRCFNENDWSGMEKLYWEDAVVVSEKENKLYQGRPEIIGFWKNYKERKAGRMLKSIQPRSETPLVRSIELIGIMATGEGYVYDMAAVDICEFTFNPEDAEMTSVVTYRHKRTCTTAISEQTVPA